MNNDTNDIVRNDQRGRPLKYLTEEERKEARKRYQEKAKNRNQTEAVNKKSRGRPLKYFTEEERKEARKKYEAQRRPARKEYNYEYLKEWRIKKKEQEDKIKRMDQELLNREKELIYAIELMKDEKKVYEELEQIRKTLNK